MEPARLIVPLLIATLALPGCGGSESSAAGGGGKLSLVAYSTPREVYEQVIPDFARTAAGKGTRFSQSYGASGDQARAVVGGLPADVVALSLAPDVKKLVDEGLVAANWDKDEHNGFVSKSVVVIGVRKGNPQGIQGWDDLIKPGVEVLTPNPFTSGGARWNVMAAVGARGEDYVKKLFGNVVVQDKSARESLQTFIGGKGDAILAYENEVITAQQAGEDIDYVVPDETILIENPIAVLAKSKNKAKAQAFVKYARSDAGQKVFAAKGYRSINDALIDKGTYPTPSGLFTIEKFGGWDEVMKRYFDPADSVMQRIESDLGVSTEK